MVHQIRTVILIELPFFFIYATINARAGPGSAEVTNYEKQEKS